MELPGAALAACTASRSEQSPIAQAPGIGSSGRVTVKLAARAGRAGGSRASATPSTKNADSRRARRRAIVEHPPVEPQASTANDGAPGRSETCADLTISPGMAPGMSPDRHYREGLGVPSP